MDEGREVTRDADSDGWTPAEGDCDDSDGSTFPGAPESCDGQDRDCDGAALPIAIDDAREDDDTSSTASFVGCTTIEGEICFGPDGVADADWFDLPDVGEQRWVELHVEYGGQLAMWAYDEWGALVTDSHSYLTNAEGQSLTAWYLSTRWVKLTRPTTYYIGTLPEECTCVSYTMTFTGE